MTEAFTIATAISQSLPGLIGIAEVGPATEINEGASAFILLTTPSGALFSCSVDRIPEEVEA